MYFADVSEAYGSRSTPVPARWSSASYLFTRSRATTSPGSARSRRSEYAANTPRRGARNAAPFITIRIAAATANFRLNEGDPGSEPFAAIHQTTGFATTTYRVRSAHQIGPRSNTHSVP